MSDYQQLFDTILSKPEFKKALSELPSEEQAIFLESIRKFVEKFHSSYIRPVEKWQETRIIQKQ
jgi:hypothetical protein